MDGSKNDGGLLGAPRIKEEWKTWRSSWGRFTVG